MSEFVRDYDAELVSAGLTLLIVLINWAFQARVRLFWGLSHGFTHGVPVHQDDGITREVLVHTTSHIVANLGRKAATGVEMTFNYRPDSFAVWPQRQFETDVNPNNRFIVKFSTLAPREQLSLNLLSVDIDEPDLLSVWCSEMRGRLINLRHHQIFTKPVQCIIAGLLLLGCFAAIYLMIQLVGWFSLLASFSA